MKNRSGWQFWIDRGGTFTDVLARRPDGEILSCKLLSRSDRYDDAAVEAMQRLLREHNRPEWQRAGLSEVRMGTTIATNALLERRGERLALITTRGFADALRIGYQNRPDIFAREIHRPAMLYDSVVEVDERIGADGDIVTALDQTAADEALRRLRRDGYDALAIVLLHAWRNPEHERRLVRLARNAGFSQISASHDSAALIRLISRGDTTVVDAYLTPLLRRYVDDLGAALSARFEKTRLLFMQSDGGLTEAANFFGRNSILSGPAAGVVAMARAGTAAGHEKLIGFDMGGTSTDVSLYAGTLERSYDSEVAGVRLRSPMMRIHTIAAGGGSCLRYLDQRLQVGPDSAGADPGPACYRRGGPLCLTDANLLLGRIHEQFFPPVFGHNADQPLSRDAARQRIAEFAGVLRNETGSQLGETEIADGFARVAVENMASAIKTISVQRGHDAQEFTLYCFGGAAGQLACRVADSLGMSRILVHPHAGVLSALGMGLAEIRQVEQRTIRLRLDEDTIDALRGTAAEMAANACATVRAQLATEKEVATRVELHCRYRGSDTVVPVELADAIDVAANFRSAHRTRYGFELAGQDLIVESLVVAAETVTEDVCAMAPERDTGMGKTVATLPFFADGRWHDARWYRRQDLTTGTTLDGPAVVIDPSATTVVDPGWSLAVLRDGHLSLTRRGGAANKIPAATGGRDPILLEVFNNLFMHIATQMGTVLQSTAHSVNIKERLDFSCALFDSDGGLIANAPHMPVHLGSMGESVRAVMDRHGDMEDGDAFILNSPYEGGTHLPDITIVSPVFFSAARPEFYVASRAHHADIGGITPGSMPPHSSNIAEEGVLFENLRILRGGALDTALLDRLLRSGPWPSRNPAQNIEDIKAQIAANHSGIRELGRLAELYSLETVTAFTRHVQENAEEAVRRAIERLDDGEFSYPMDHGQQVGVAITVDRERRCATIDFSGTSPQQDNNFNAPRSVCIAAVLYVFRTLVDHAIPLNEGCLKPLNILIPDGSMLSPSPPAAVVAGNVETSQCVVDALYGALGIQAAAQGTMNNLTFGNDRWQYYETICGGSGAGSGYHGTDAIQTHMTNSRLTDPEILEQRFPVRLRSFSIRSESGGRGRFRGGNGVVREIEFLEPMEAAILSGHRRVAPFGLAGGGEGATGHNAVRRADGTMIELAPADVVAVRPGDTLIVKTPGGGAYGACGQEKGEDNANE